jgi:biotin synthase
MLYGEKLRTPPQPEADPDRTLFARLGIRPEAGQVTQQADVPLYQNQSSAGLWYDAAARGG